MIGIPVTLAREMTVKDDRVNWSDWNTCYSGREMAVKDDRVNWSDWNTCYSGQGDGSER